MDAFLQNSYLRLIEQQGSFGLDGAARLHDAVARFKPDTIWFGVQQLLVGAGNVAKVLWGASGKKADEREPLRVLLGVEDDSPLQATAVRNDFEHMDERISSWWSSGSRTFVDSNIGPLNMYGGDTRWVFRQYDPPSGALTFWTDEFKVREVEHELRRVTEIAHAKTSQFSAASWDARRREARS